MINTGEQILTIRKTLSRALLFKKEEFFCLEERGYGRFLKEYVYSIIDSLVNS